MAGYERLFDGGELTHHFRWLLQYADKLLLAIPKERFMNARAEEVVENIVGQVTVESRVIFMEQAGIIPHETTMDVSRSMERNPFQDPGPIMVKATKLVLSIPFTGDRRLWNLRPQTSPFEHPEAAIKGDDLLGGILELQAVQPVDAPQEYFRAWKERTLDIIGRYLLSQHQDILRFNADLPSQVAHLVSERRQRLQQTDGLQDLLGIPLRRNPDAPSLTPIQLPRRVVRDLPPVPKTGFESEPGIEEGEYQRILDIVRHEGRTFETKPATFAKFDEEELRDVLLAHLNGHYKGEATSETFRGKGKTDICIEDKDRAAFIGECKIWKGKKELLEAIDQLLGYLTWRDCKAAVIIFNKKVSGFSTIQATIPGVFEAHSLYRATTTRLTQHGEWQFQMRSSEDEGRRLRVHVFAFNLYVVM